jgi:hypothetical protein
LAELAQPLKKPSAIHQAPLRSTEQEPIIFRRAKKRHCGNLSGQLSAFSDQQSAFSDQQSAFSDQQSAFSDRLFAVTRLMVEAGAFRI